MTTYWIARCDDCGVDMPFWIEAERDEWAQRHSEARDWSGNRHTITVRTEQR